MIGNSLRWIAPENAKVRELTGPIIAIFCIGLMVESILPWSLIWLSDVFFFDVPGWSLWLLFGGPPTLSLLAILIHWVLRRSASPASRAPPTHD
jgi:hypothetical protein